MTASLRVVLGNQLFPIECLPSPQRTIIFMAEDLSLCTDVRHHKLKLILFLAAMRNYAAELEMAGYKVCYYALGDRGETLSYEKKLTATVQSLGVREVSFFEIEDKPMEQRLTTWADRSGLTTRVEPSPMFLCSRKRFEAFLSENPKPRMADFYRVERQRLGLLLEADGSPAGGRWSHDADNRRKLPADVEPPELPLLDEQPNVAAVTKLVEARFAGHPGQSGPFWLPVTRRAALGWMEQFIDERLGRFGAYQDAISRRSRGVFHSALSSSLNLGLITPAEVLKRVLARADELGVPLNSLEGFIRQLIGWREFVRGIYRNFHDRQSETNHWGHSRQLSESWYRGETGIEPLDVAIRTALSYGWDHHIPRLMIVGNLMTLAEVAPTAAHEWFMEMYVDSSEWVMGPNVYGMATYSDGGLFATKPYICGSNYLLKMSDYEPGPWCDIVDGLYWRFVSRHREFLSANPRLSMMPRAFDRLKPERWKRIKAAAEGFLSEHTRMPDDDATARIGFTATSNA